MEKQKTKTGNGTSTSEIAIKYYTTFNVETGIILIDLQPALYKACTQVLT